MYGLTHRKVQSQEGRLNCLCPVLIFHSGPMEQGNVIVDVGIVLA